MVVHSYKIVDGQQSGVEKRSGGIAELIVTAVVFDATGKYPTSHCLRRNTGCQAMRRVRIKSLSGRVHHCYPPIHNICQSHGHQIEPNFSQVDYIRVVKLSGFVQ